MKCGLRQEFVIGGFTLPTKGELFHTLSLGIDYKHFAQTLSLGHDAFDSPVTYAPLVASYGATWQADGRLTQLNASITTGLRGIGSSPEEFDAKRFKATGSFIHLNADVSHTQDVPGGAQLFAKIQGQVADQPLMTAAEQRTKLQEYSSAAAQPDLRAGLFGST